MGSQQALPPTLVSGSPYSAGLQVRILYRVLGICTRVLVFAWPVLLPPNHLPNPTCTFSEAKIKAEIVCPVTWERALAHRPQARNLKSDLTRGVSQTTTEKWVAQHKGRSLL